MDKKICEFANQYFEKKYDSIQLLHIDEDKIVVEDKCIGIKIAIPFSVDIDFNKMLEEIEECKDEDKQALDSCCEEFEYSLNYENIKKLNPKLKVFENKGYKIGDSIELLIHYSVIANEKNETGEFAEWATFDMWDFNIDNIKVNIGNPSNLFEVIFHEYEDDDYFVGWQAYTTLKLKGITNENYKDILQQVMFWIYQMCPSPYDFHFPDLGRLCWEVGESEIGFGEESEARLVFKAELKNKKFTRSRHAEPIYFYNAAKRINDPDISFLYFYKVLEYYFIIAQRETIKNVINEYNKSNNIDSFIETMHNEYFGKKEDKLLKAMFGVLPDIIIDRLCSDAFSQKLINDNSLDNFVDILYQHRNSIVHGKHEFKSFFLKVPDQLDDDTGTKWTQIIEKIAYNLILKFCYGK